MPARINSVFLTGAPNLALRSFSSPNATYSFLGIAMLSRTSLILAGFSSSFFAATGVATLGAGFWVLAAGWAARLAPAAGFGAGFADCFAAGLAGAAGGA